MLMTFAIWYKFVAKGLSSRLKIIFKFLNYNDFKHKALHVRQIVQYNNLF